MDSSPSPGAAGAPHGVLRLFPSPRPGAPQLFVFVEIWIVILT